MKACAAALLVAVTACGPTARGPESATAAPRRAGPSPDAVASLPLDEATRAADLLEAREDALARGLREVGASNPHLAGRGFLANRESAVHEVDVPGGACVTFTALATDGIRDLDAQLFHPSGALLTADAAEDAHPTLQVCARGGAPRRLAIRLVNFEGNGAYRLEAFTSAEAALPAIARAIGGTPGRVRDDDADPSAARIAGQVEAARRRGFTALAEPREVALAPAQPIWVPVAMRTGQCLLTFVLPEGDLEQVSARLLDGDGAELARASDTESEATLQFCADRQRELVLVLAATRGRGQARVLTFTAPAAQLGGGSYLWFGQTTRRRAAEEAANASSASSDCASLTRAALARAESGGFHATAPPRCPSLSRGEAVRAVIPIGAGQCVRVEVVAGRGVARPTVALSVEGSPVTAHVGSGLGAPAIVHACSATARELDADVVARSGHGVLGLVVTTRPAAGPDVEAETRRLDAYARAAATVPLRLADDEGVCSASSVRALDVAPGTCSGVTFVADRAAHVSVCAVRGDVSVACDEGPAPEVAHCAPPDASRRLELRCTPREGEAARGHWIVATRRPPP